MTKRFKKFDEDYELRECFRKFDKEDNNYVTLENLKTMLYSDGEPLTSAELNEWLQNVEDFVKNGKLYYEDLASYMLSK